MLQKIKIMSKKYPNNYNKILTRHKHLKINFNKHKKRLLIISVKFINIKNNSKLNLISISKNNSNIRNILYKKLIKQ